DIVSTTDLLNQQLLILQDQISSHLPTPQVLQNQPLEVSLSQTLSSPPWQKKLSHSSPKLKKVEAIHLQKLEKDAADLNLSSLPSDIAETFRVWPVNLATCKLHHRWADLTSAFWPRWLLQTDCERPEKERSCSFPKGMKCVRAQTAGEVKRCLWRQVSHPVLTSCIGSCK
uniref:Noggin n=1 Tax=Xiphophorus couchianus TaxID=32473 RepID=A0A3B5LYW3_9TELE